MKTVLLLSIAREEAIKVCNTFSFTEDQAKENYHVVFKKFDDYCASQVNETSALSVPHTKLPDTILSQAVHSKGAPLHNCWGFIDGTARAICRPSKDQKRFFSGHKRFHALKYQSIMCPNGIICQLSGPYVSSRHDASIFRKSNTYRKLEKLAKGHSFCLYGDPAYPLRSLLLKPYGGNVTVQQRAFNKRMSSVRQAVECGFGKIAGLFAFLDFRKNQRLKRQKVSRMYKVGTIFANCHTCMYGSQVSQYFQVEPPQLEEYLRPKNRGDSFDTVSLFV
ncbi:uncharacterized protein LOC142765428 [Rhipicephalus microplus]|uniref:uncharacterized protein LOC142765428 n=1 Tax=Rhipicephalus microplus TaxID=6941 RepID=UPI003F6CE448